MGQWGIQRERHTSVKPTRIKKIYFEISACLIFIIKRFAIIYNYRDTISYKLSFASKIKKKSIDVCVSIDLEHVAR